MKRLLHFSILCLGLNFYSKAQESKLNFYNDSFAIKTYCDTNIVTINYKSAVSRFNLTNEKDLMVKYIKKTIEIDKKLYPVLNNTDLIVDLIKAEKKRVLYFGVLKYEQLSEEINFFYRQNNGLKSDLDTFCNSLKKENFSVAYGDILKSLKDFDYYKFNSSLELLKTKLTGEKLADVYYLQAFNSINHFKFYAALSQINLALEINNKNFEYLFLKANILVKLNQIDAGIECLVTNQSLASDENQKRKNFYALGYFYTEKKELQKAINSYDAALTHAEKIFEPNDTNIASVLKELSYVHSLLGNYAKAIEYREKVYNSYKVAYSENNTNTAEILNQLAFLHKNNGDYEEALNLYDQSLKINEFFWGKENLATALVLNNIGSTYSDKKEHKKANEYYEKVLKIRLKILGNNNSMVANSLNNLGFSSHNLNELDKAINYYQQAIQIKRSIFLCNSSDIATSLSNIGGVYKSQKNGTLALRYFENSLFVLHDCFDTSAVSLAKAYNNIAGSYCSLGNYDTAITIYQKALSLYESEKEAAVVKCANVYNNIGFTFQEKGDNKEAVNYYNKALQIFEKKLGNESYLTNSVNANLGLAYVELKEFEKAFFYLEKASQYYKKDFENNIELIREVDFYIGCMFVKQGKNNEALEMLEKSLFYETTTYKKAQGLNNLGYKAFKKNEFSEAINYYLIAKKVIENETDTKIRSLLPLVTYNLAKAYCADGQKQNAVDTYKKSMLLYEGTVKAKEYTEIIKKNIEECK